jgi:hypothetical protein
MNEKEYEFTIINISVHSGKINSGFQFVDSVLIGKVNSGFQLGILFIPERFPER